MKLKDFQLRLAFNSKYWRLIYKLKTTNLWFELNIIRIAEIRVDVNGDSSAPEYITYSCIQISHGSMAIFSALFTKYCSARDEDCRP